MKIKWFTKEIKIPNWILAIAILVGLFSGWFKWTIASEDAWEVVGRDYVVAGHFKPVVAANAHRDGKRVVEGDVVRISIEELSDSAPGTRAMFVAGCKRFVQRSK